MGHHVSLAPNRVENRLKQACLGSWTSPSAEANNAAGPATPRAASLAASASRCNNTAFVIFAVEWKGPMSLPVLADVRIGIIGLGYVGLPLAVYLARHFPVIGFDIDRQRVAELRSGLDRTREVTEEEFAQAERIAYAADAESLKEANFYIVTVPTPVDQAKRPDLSALVAASEIVGSVLSPGNIVVFESTVYPGATEEVCVPVLEQGVGPRFQSRFLRRLFAGAHQSRRPDSPPSRHRQGHFGFDAGGSRPRRPGLCHRHFGRDASRELYPRGRSRQSDREHPARRQYCADQ